MIETSAKSNLRGWLDTILIGAFCLLLLLPAADTLFHLDRATGFSEKRGPAPFPRFKGNVAGLQVYTKGLEEYFNDHFGWRKQLIHWHHSLQVAVFHAETTGKVALGKAGWLYYSATGRRVDWRQFSQPELEHLRQALESRRDWLAQRGIAYLFVVAPDKQSIYPEYLPSWLKPPDRHSKLDQFIAYMACHSTVPVLDLRPCLQQAKAIGPTYFRTDTHWNFLGGFVACEEMVRALCKQIPDLHPLGLDSFKLIREPGKGGDLADMLGVFAEDENVTLTPGPTLPVLAETVQNPEFVEPTYFTTNSYAAGSALVFRDSFGTSMRPFLGYHFNTVSYVWTAGDFDTEWVKQMNPSVVISEIVERNFNVERPAGFLCSMRGQTRKF